MAQFYSIANDCLILSGEVKRSMKVECLICLRETAIPQNLNTQTYDGQITCRECGSLLQVKLVKSKVEQCKVVRVGHPILTR